MPCPDRRQERTLGTLCLDLGQEHSEKRSVPYLHMACSKCEQQLCTHQWRCGPVSLLGQRLPSPLPALSGTPCGRAYPLVLGLRASYISRFPFSFQRVRDLLMVRRFGKVKTKHSDTQEGVERPRVLRAMGSCMTSDSPRGFWARGSWLGLSRAFHAKLL